MKLIRRGAVALALIASAGGTAAIVSASTASAAIPPPVTISATSVAGRTVHLSPRVTVSNFRNFSATSAVPGFTLSSNTLEVCVTVPHVTPAVGTTVLALCSWRLTSTANTIPKNTISGQSVLTPNGQVGRVLSGTGAWRGAHGLPLSFREVNVAPGTTSDTIVFRT